LKAGATPKELRSKKKKERERERERKREERFSAEITQTL